MIISSVNNQTIKELCKLKDAAQRKKSKLFILEGERLVFDFLSYSSQNIEICKWLILREDRQDFLNKLNGFTQSKLMLVSSTVFDKLSDTKSPQGIMAVVESKTLKAQKPSGNYLVLDSISDAGNLGAIIRTAAAAGFYDIYLVNCADVHNPKTLRASMGGFWFCNFHEVEQNELMSLIQATTLLCADLQGQSVFEFKPNKEPIGLIIGNEAHGVSDELKNMATGSVSIPMHNVESLNAAVAASIIMYQIINNSGGF